ncbi:MAG: M36 family metallopeptidase [Nostoc sp. EfeVER01]|uniref:M36 family metallopeptidase n=1 Tax=unclassified Nostoc TaxID=2593658 RepID=UPI002AD2B06E|nr:MULTISPECIES: M36 family metallopeptidase [unclassified Nostoc]MDZ7946416.1 M36 family metallopeptidase [Nostoc sp. EfeVER01]MDZ7993083.1 M36 family metallopeptidase [Nostoc sp. EspVER01]
MKTSRLFNFVLIALLSLGVVVVMKDNSFQTNSTKNAIASEIINAPQARVYLGLPQSQVNAKTADKIKPKIVKLPNLLKKTNEPWRLKGKQVEVVNYGVLVEKDNKTGELRGVPMGNAEGDSFLYDPASGGSTPRQNEEAKGRENDLILSAARFGEVNAYYHTDRTLTYANSLLAELGEKPLPYLRVVVNDHSCSQLPGYRQNDCDKRSGEALSFGGGHYRRPSDRFDDEGFEHQVEEINSTGEVHLGPGNDFIKDANGDRVVVNSYPYNENPSHNAAIIIHETAHHIVSHTADFRENQNRQNNQYSNRKIHLDEGTCDYWTAVMLNSPDIYEWQRANEKLTDKSNRNLSGPRTTANFVQDGDPHENGNIWSSTLWDLRQAIGDGRKTDLLLMKTLLLFGEIEADNPKAKRKIRRNEKIDQKDEFRDGLAKILKADKLFYKNANRTLIINTFAKRGIDLKTPDSTF